MIDLKGSQFYKQQALEYFNSFLPKHISIIKSFAVPPSLVPQVMFCNLRILSGLYSHIQVDSNGDPKENTWKSVHWMLKSPNQWRQACCNIFDHIGRNQTLDRHITQVKQILHNSDIISPEQLCYKSQAAQGVCGWIMGVIKYKEALYAEREKQLREF